MIDKKKWLVVAVGVLVLAVISIYVFKPRNIAYIENAKIYAQFKLKVELEAKLEKVKLERKNILDSTYIQLKMMAQKIERENIKDQKILYDFESSRQIFVEKQKQIEEDNQALASKYTEQIWTQLNQYIRDYGKKKGYDLILGTTSDGNIMYADENLNITDELIMYVNERYEGK